MKQITALLITLLLALPCFAEGLPELGAPSQIKLSPNKEAKWGKDFMMHLKERGLLFNDPLATDYIKSIGNRLVTANSNADRHFHFFIVNDMNINAFAGPDGYIGINAGLILTTQNESELAAVLAHEIAHVTQGHLARKLEEASKLKKSSIAAMATAIAIGTQSPQAASAALAATFAGTQQDLLNFSRENEKEADRIGMDILNHTGYDPSSMSTFFLRLQRSERYYDHLPELLSTHPLTEDRIADAESRTMHYLHKHYKNSFQYELITARLKAELTRDPHAALIYFRDNLATDTHTNQDAMQYGYSLSLLETQEPLAAHDILRDLHERYPNNLMFAMSLAHAQMALEHTSEGLATLDNAYELHPDNYAINLDYARNLIKTGHSRHAMTILERYLLNYPRGPKPYGTLSRAQAAAGYKVQAYQTRAKYFLKQGQPEQAIQQLQMGLQLPKVSKNEEISLTAQIDAIEKSID